MGSEDGSGSVEIKADGGVLAAIIDNTEKLNALSWGVQSGLREAVRRAEGSDVSVLLLAGRGRAFSSGGDMAEMSVEDDAEARRYISDLTDLLIGLRSLPKPIVAAVQGYAAGGGAEIALEADLLVLARDAVFRQPDVGIGSTPATAYRLVQLVGPAIAARLVLAGEDLTADDLLRLGVVGELHDPDDLLESAIALARRVAGQNPRSLRYAKQALRLPFTTDPMTDLRVNLQSELDCYWNPEQREAVAAFLGGSSRGS